MTLIVEICSFPQNGIPKSSIWMGCFHSKPSSYWVAPWQPWNSQEILPASTDWCAALACLSPSCCSPGAETGEHPGFTMGKCGWKPPRNGWWSQSELSVEMVISKIMGVNSFVSFILRDNLWMASELRCAQCSFQVQNKCWEELALEFVVASPAPAFPMKDGFLAIPKADVWILEVIAQS